MLRTRNDSQIPPFSFAELLLEAADQLDMQVYLPQPSVPGNPNPSVYGGGAFYEFLDRVMENYKKLYGSHKSYVGIYQNNEGALVGVGLEDYAAGYQVCADKTHAQGKIFCNIPIFHASQMHGPGTKNSQRRFQDGS